MSLIRLFIVISVYFGLYLFIDALLFFEKNYFVEKGIWINFCLFFIDIVFFREKENYNLDLFGFFLKEFIVWPAIFILVKRFPQF